MNNKKIKSIKAIMILDSNARPVVETTVTTESEIQGIGIAPTGTSVGRCEAFVLRDHEENWFMGNGVNKAIDIVNHVIGPALLGMDVTDQNLIDQTMLEMDGTPMKTKLGGNSIYSISVACAKAAAALAGVPYYEYVCKGSIRTLPVPVFNMINGGQYKHLTMSLQEFSVIPWGADSMLEAMNIGVSVFGRLKMNIAKYQNGPAMMGNYCGWAPPTSDPIEMMKLLADTVEECGFTDKVAYHLDGAANGMYDIGQKKYWIAGKCVSVEELIDIYKDLTEQYPILFVEDILEETDWDGYARASRAIAKSVVIGDDLIVTNKKNLMKAHELKAAGGFVFKPNQVGTITECREARKYAGEHHMLTVPSLRAGGVVGDIVTDLAIGLETQAIKCGACRAGERIYSQNFLLKAAYAHPEAKLYDFSLLIKNYWQ